jgi:hypothetical protein
VKETVQECEQTEDGGSICVTTRFIVQESGGNVILHITDRWTVTSPDGEVTTRVNQRVLGVNAGSDVPDTVPLIPGNVIHASGTATLVVDRELCTTTFAVHVTNGEARYEREFTEDCFL